ncbi:MAG: hypothetical protein IPK26_08210 [Planctomycetes bacterium]|nr:hypothetical protein [Planctomycetota bacterium]
MKALQRSVGFILAALLLVLPVLGGGGGGGGDGGVWILPSMRQFGSGGPAINVAEPRATREVAESSPGELCRVDSRMSEPTATFASTVLQSAAAIGVSGHEVFISASALQAVRTAGLNSADVIIMDGQRRGYIIQIAVKPNGFELRLF